MVYRRRAPMRRRTGRKLRRSIPRRVPRPMRTGEIMLKRTIARELWAFTGASVDGFWRYYSATLGQIPSISDITNLFSAVKVCALKYTFRPRFTELAWTQAGAPTIGMGYAHVLVDPRSNVTPSGTYTRANCNAFLENGGAVKSYPVTKPFSVYIAKPCQPQDNDSSSNGRYDPSTWVNPVAAIANPYRGFHIFIQDSNFVGAVGIQFDVFVTYYMKCKGLR